jgi:hypothetical protein
MALVYDFVTIDLICCHLLSEFTVIYSLCLAKVLLKLIDYCFLRSPFHLISKRLNWPSMFFIRNPFKQFKKLFNRLVHRSHVHEKTSEQQTKMGIDIVLCRNSDKKGHLSYFL